MNKILLVLTFLLSCKITFAQIDSSDIKDHALYLYKTEKDFFNKNKIYRGQYVPNENIRVINYTIANSKKRKLNLDDSCTYYFGYQIGDEIQIRPDKDPNNHTYYSFGGGTIDHYCVVIGSLPNYDRQGYLLGLTTPGGRAYMYFNDRKNNLNMVPIAQFLKSKPKLLDRYMIEKNGIDPEQWERKRLAVSIKYLKLFVAESITK